MSKIARRVVVASGLILVCAVAGGGRVSAQIPDKFTNLEVLPKDIGKRELVDIMRRFSMALGARCTFCHVAEKEGSFEGVDFASDAMEHKKTARVMMRMVDEINGKLLPAAGLKSPTQVRCVTCHRGVEKPESLDNLVLATIAEGGVEAGLDKYRELRAKYYGQGSYDFGAGTLETVAEVLAQKQQSAEDAIRVLEVNVDDNPQASFSFAMLGQLYTLKGDKAAAIANFERSLEIEPDNPRARQALESLKSSQ